MAAGLNNCTFLLNAHDFPGYHFPICITFVVLQLAECPLEKTTAECIPWANRVAGHTAPFTRNEIKQTGWFKLTFNEYTPQADTCAILWCNQQVMPAENSQSSQDSRIF